LPRAMNFRAPVAIIALILTLGVCLGAFSVYNRYLVEKPMQEEMLQVQGVKKVELRREKKINVITVEMAELPDFSSAYQAVDNIARERFGPEGYTLQIKDRRDENLQKVYDSLQLYLYQGIATNSFLWLDQEVGKVAADKHLRYGLRVDDRNLYLQLHRDGHYLYAIIERGEKEKTENQGGR